MPSVPDARESKATSLIVPESTSVGPAFVVVHPLSSSAATAVTTPVDRIRVTMPIGRARSPAGSARVFVDEGALHAAMAA